MDKTAKSEADQAKPTRAARIKGAQFLGGQWLAADGTPLADAEARQAHQAMDAAAMQARENALLARGEQ